MGVRIKKVLVRGARSEVRVPSAPSYSRIEASGFIRRAIGFPQRADGGRSDGSSLGHLVATLTAPPLFAFLRPMASFRVVHWPKSPRPENVAGKCLHHERAHTVIVFLDRLKDVLRSE